MSDSSRVIEYATPAGPSSIPTAATIAFIIAALFLSLASWIVVFIGADQEPYYGGVRKMDAVVQVGIGTTLIVLWIGWAVTLAASVWREKTHILWLTALLWMAINCFYLAAGIDGYLQDVITYEQKYLMPVVPTVPPVNAPTTAPASPQ